MEKIRVGSAVIVEKDGKILLGRRGKEPDFGAIIIPGGGVDMYEDFRETAKREILEEAGIEITNLRQLGAYQIIRAEKQEHRVIIYWQADWKSGEVKSSSDLLDAKFYTRKELQVELKNDKIKGITFDVLKDAKWI